MNVKKIQIVLLSTSVMLFPAVLFGQAEAGNMPEAMSQGQGNASGMPTPRQSRENQTPAMQDSTANSGQTPQMIKDKMFLRKAAEGGLAEVQFGKLATQKAVSEDVKTFAQKMVDDHSEFSKGLEPVADSMGVKLPTHLSKEDQAEYEKLNGLSGEEFDNEYLTVMVRDHHKDLRAFRLEAANAQDPALRNTIVKGEHMIHEHMVMADKLAKNKGLQIPHHFGNKPPAPPAPPPQ
ncbi:MAG TPA: DUF4142 domain-containing protein [Edaphobacter sp.]|nr:DUF4142 domain-containing protein [Edaphobacter sp.]